MSETPEQAAESLRRGELILLPTETVYGLGGDAGDPKAVAAIFEAKGRLPKRSAYSMRRRARWPRPSGPAR